MASKDTNLNKLGDITAGALSGALARMIVAPLDVIKIRLQLQVSEKKRCAASGAAPPPPRYTGVVQAACRVVAEEGLRALWRGNAAAMALWVTYAAVQFPLYRWTKDWMTDATAPPLPVASSGSSSSYTAVPPERSKLAVAGISIAAGAVSGNIATAATYPLDWVRTRFAAQGVPRAHETVRSLVASEYAAHGSRVFFRGLFPTLLSVTPQLGITFYSYETVGRAIDTAYTSCVTASLCGTDHDRALLARPHGSRGGTVTAADAYSVNDSRSLPPPPVRLTAPADMRSLLAGALAGIIGKFVVYPLDTVKKRLQMSGVARPAAYGPQETYTGAWDALVKIARKEGIVRGWYKGTVPSIMKAAMGAALTFWSYDAATRTLERYQCFRKPGVPAPGTGDAGVAAAGVTSSTAARRLS